MKELKLLLGYSKYGVTKDAEIWSFKLNRLLKPQPRGNYLKVTLYNDKGQRKQLSIHRIMAEVFCKNPENKPCVNHINGNKHDNRASNLEWVTWSENTKHAVKTGLLKGRPKKLRDKQRLTFSLIEQGLSHKNISERTGISKSMISSIKCGKRWEVAAREYGFKPTTNVGIGRYIR